ncbi:MAG: cobalamin B12-binding domain-containing protein, partial [Desulfobacterales bacterium]
DMGALTVALTAAEYGWHPLYYGPNLPVEEIAAAVNQCSARAVAISITHLLDQHPLISELRKLRRYIGNDLILFVGGQAVSGHPQIIEEINAKHIPNIDQLSEELNSAFNGNVD